MYNIQHTTYLYTHTQYMPGGHFTEFTVSCDSAGVHPVAVHPHCLQSLMSYNSTV